MFLTPHGGNLVILVPKIRVVVLDFALAFGVIFGCYRNGNLVSPPPPPPSESKQNKHHAMAALVQGKWNSDEYFVFLRPHTRHTSLISIHLA